MRWILPTGVSSAARAEEMPRKKAAASARMTIWLISLFMTVPFPLSPWDRDAKRTRRQNSVDPPVKARLALLILAVPLSWRLESLVRPVTLRPCLSDRYAVFQDGAPAAPATPSSLIPVLRARGP